MASTAALPARRVEQFFQISLVLLLANGFFAILFTGRIDAATAVLVGAALIVRLMHVVDVVRFELPKWAVTLVSIAYIVFYPIDYLLLSGSFISAGVRMLFFFTAVKLLSAKTRRDYLYLGVLAFLHLLTASLFVAGVGYFGVLLLFLCLGTAAIVSFEIKSGCESGRRVVEGPGARSIGGLGRRLAAVSVVMAAGILTLSIGLFLVLPRVSGRAPASPLRFDPLIGFSSEVDLGATGTLQPDNTPVMRVEALQGDVHQLRWRGLALTHFDGRRWSSRSPRSQLIETGPNAAPARFRRSQTGNPVHYRVTLEPVASQALFVAGVPEQIISGSFDRLVVDETDSLRVLDGGMQTLQYEVVSWIADRGAQQAAVSEYFPPRFQSLYLQTPALDPRIPALAREIVGARQAPMARAEAIENYLRTEFTYTLRLPSRRRSDPLAHFLFERHRGHCEYFASAMTVMLRSLGVPARLVNGFAGGVDNPISGLHVIRARDAHSWVEAYVPGHGWLEFDPSPPTPDAVMNAWLANAWMYWDAVQSAWSDWVLDYDFSQQLHLARAVQASTRNAAFHFVQAFDERLNRVEEILGGLKDFRGRAPAADPLMLIGMLAAFTGLAASAAILLKLLPVFAAAQRARRLRSGQGRPADSTFFYRRALQVLERRGIERPAWQTPEEFVRAAEPSEFRGLLEQITAAYSAARYGRDREAEQRLPRLVRALERARI